MFRLLVMFCMGFCLAAATYASALSAAIASVEPAASSAPNDRDKNLVHFRSGDLTLIGFLFKPDGPGPFPAVLWNHGSERNPGLGKQFEDVASIFVPHNYVVFAPVRRGHGRSEGPYIVDTVNKVRAAHGEDEANKVAVRLLETEQLNDQLAGLAYLTSQPYVDPKRVVAAGCSYGGIESLLAAEHEMFRGAIAISPAALSWERNESLRARLVLGAGKAVAPVLLLQPAKDASLEPERVLGAEFKRLGKPFTGKVYPAVGPEQDQKHCFGGATHVWADDALKFADKVTGPLRK